MPVARCLALLVFVSGCAALDTDTNLFGRLLVMDGYTPPTCSTATGNGDLCVESDLEVQGAQALTGNMTVGGTLGVTGATTLSSTLGVTGATTLSSTLGVTGASTLSGAVNVTKYDVDYVVAAGGVALGPTAPSWASNGSCEGLGFDADAEEVHIVFHMPDCWAGGASDDLVLSVYWCPEDGQAPADGEVVKWDISYRSIDWGTEDVDNGTLATGTVSYTQSGAGDEGDTFEHLITIDADDANQPIANGDVVIIHFDRDWAVASNYPHDAIIVNWELEAPQDSLLCDHQN